MLCFKELLHAWNPIKAARIFLPTHFCKCWWRATNSPVCRVLWFRWLKLLFLQPFPKVQSTTYSCFQIFLTTILFVINAVILSYMQAVTWKTPNAINALHLRSNIFVLCLVIISKGFWFSCCLLNCIMGRKIINKTATNQPHVWYGNTFIPCFSSGHGDKNWGMRFLCHWMEMLEDREQFQF